MDKKTELEKAQALLASIEKEKQEAFAKEINAICEKHGYTLQVQSQIVTVKK